MEEVKLESVLDRVSKTDSLDAKAELLDHAGAFHSYASDLSARYIL